MNPKSGPVEEKNSRRRSKTKEKLVETNDEKIVKNESNEPLKLGYENESKEEKVVSNAKNDKITNDEKPIRNLNEDRIPRNSNEDRIMRIDRTRDVNENRIIRNEKISRNISKDDRLIQIRDKKLDANSFDISEELETPEIFRREDVYENIKREKLHITELQRM